MKRFVSEIFRQEFYPKLIFPLKIQSAKPVERVPSNFMKTFYNLFIFLEIIDWE